MRKLGPHAAIMSQQCHLVETKASSTQEPWTMFSTQTMTPHNPFPMKCQLKCRLTLDGVQAREGRRGRVAA